MCRPIGGDWQAMTGSERASERAGIARSCRSVRNAVQRTPFFAPPTGRPFFAFQPTHETRDQADAARLRRSGAGSATSDVVPAVYAEKGARTRRPTALPAAAGVRRTSGADRRALRSSTVAHLVHVLHLRLLVRPPKGLPLALSRECNAFMLLPRTLPSFVYTLNYNYILPDL